jgi:hypothetical protein
MLSISKPLLVGQARIYHTKEFASEQQNIGAANGTAIVNGGNENAVGGLALARMAGPKRPVRNSWKSKSRRRLSPFIMGMGMDWVPRCPKTLASRYP